MNYKKSCLSVAVASAFLFTASAVSATGGGDPELAVPERRIKYSRAVLFGDSQLDTGNITKEIKVGQSTRSLSMGAPFTPGSGNFAQQLFGMDIVNANPMKFRERFDPPLFSFELSISNDAGGAFDYSDDKVINMAQGGGKLLNSWPGDDKRVYRTLAQAVIDDYFPRGNFLQNIARGVMEKGTDSIIDFMAERELVLVDKISTQPKKYSDLGGSFASDDIAIIMAGGNDVIEQGYSKARRDTDIALVELAQARERLLDDVASLGAKNIFFANIPDIGVTPTLLNWEEGGQNLLHLGDALEKSVAEEKINKLTSALNIQTTVAALNSTLKHSGPDGVIVTLVDIHRLIRAVAKEKDRYGLYGDLSGDCDSDVSCKNSKAVEDVIFLTQDGLHPSEKTSKIFAKAYLDYLHAPNAAISARKHGDVRYDASRDAFVNLTTIFHDGTLSHHVDGGLLDLSFQDQVNALTEQVKLSAAVLYFNQKSENYNGSAYTHQLDSDLLLSDSTDGGGGIDVAGEDAELKFTGSATGGPFLKTGLGKLILLGDSAPGDTYIANGSL
ncbi:TPA: hypothetical protein NIC52_005938, partial [Pseudomonas aeruginosa]|nr:hypothetical protein [Pseudomonas aeruginosa]